MKDQRKTEIKVGVTVIVGIIIFLWVFGWAKNYNLVSTQKFLLLKFPTVSGLEVGDNVTINGVRKGYVEEIVTQGDKVFVRASLDNTADLRSDATFALTMMDLMGAKKIEINPGTSPNQLNYNKVYNGTYYTDIPAALALVGKVQDDLVGIIKGVEKTLTNVDKYLGDEKLNSDIKTSIKNLTEISQKLNVMIDENRSNVKQLSKNSVELTGNAIELTKNTKDFINSNKDDVHNTIILAKSSLQKTDSLIAKLNVLVDETNSQKNNAGKFLHNDELYKDVTETLKQVKDLVKVLNEQLNGQGVNVHAKIKVF